MTIGHIYKKKKLWIVVLYSFISIENKDKDSR